jgi:hypothetical protein
LAPRIRSHWKRLVWICAGVALGLILVILAGGWFELRYRGQRELEAAIAETEQVDPHWRLEALEASRQPLPPPEKNGFVQMERAAAARPGGDWPRLAVPGLENDLPYHARVAAALRKSLGERDRFSPTLLNEEQVRALRPELERAKTCLMLARAQVDFPYGRGPSIVPENGATQANVPLYMPAMEVAKTLLPDTRVRVFDGDLRGALHNVRALLHLSQALAEEPNLMAQLVRCAIDALAVDQLEIVLAGGDLPDGNLAQIQRELEAEVASTKCPLGIRGERARTDWLLKKIQMEGASREELRAMVLPVSASKPGVLELVLQEIRFAAICADLAGVRSRGLRLMNEYDRIGKLPLHERHNELKALSERSQPSYFDLWGSGAAYTRILMDEIPPAALLTCSIVAVAMERFRLINHRWPDRLEELVPAYLKAIPLDPFDGQPVRLVRKGTASLIYSVGPNQIDDHGTLNAKSNATGADLGFILHDPAQRRRPGPPFVLPKRDSKDDKSAKGQPKRSGSEKSPE